MAYNEKLATRIRERLTGLPNIEEKKMMGGLAFMYNGKMCVGIFRDQLMCRIDPAFHEEAIKKKGCKTMDFSNRSMIGYVVIGGSGMSSKKDFDYWINLSLKYNPQAKTSKKKK